jgi:Zn-dependent peptidase ImmA (M78 family)
MIVRGSLVERRSSEEIEAITLALRSEWGLSHNERFPIVPVVELVVGEGFQVLPVEEMEKTDGLTYPDLGILQIREDVYLAACADDGRARDTMAHELGHFFLHRGMSMARKTSRGIVGKTDDSEWQADEFSSLLLAPTHIITGRTAAEISSRCGLTMQTAIYRQQKAKHR